MFRIKTESRTRRDYSPLSLTLWSAGAKRQKEVHTRLADRLRSGQSSCIAPKHELTFRKIGPNLILGLLLAKATQAALAGSENRPYRTSSNPSVIYRERKLAARKLT